MSGFVSKAVDKRSVLGPAAITNYDDPLVSMKHKILERLNAAGIENECYCASLPATHKPPMKNTDNRDDEAMGKNDVYRLIELDAYNRVTSMIYSSMQAWKVGLGDYREISNDVDSLDDGDPPHWNPNMCYDLKEMANRTISPVRPFDTMQHIIEGGERTLELALLRVYLIPHTNHWPAQLASSRYDKILSTDLGMHTDAVVSDYVVDGENKFVLRLVHLIFSDISSNLQSVKNLCTDSDALKKLRLQYLRILNNKNKNEEVTDEQCDVVIPREVMMDKRNDIPSMWNEIKLCYLTHYWLSV